MLNRFIFYFSSLFIFIPQVAFASEPKPWQFGLQDPAGVIAEMATDLHDFLLIVITLISLFVLGLLAYVCLRYKESSNPNPTRTSHNTVIEILWTVIPVLILVVIAVPSFKLLYLQETDKPFDMVIKVTGNQWYWNYEFPDENVAYDSYMIPDDEIKGEQKRLLEVDNPLIVPEGKKIKFLITGNDVMHSFFVPSLALQVYSFAGRVNEIWTEIPIGEKKYYGQCNQICGVNHSYMPIVIKAVKQQEFEKWLKEAKIKFAKFDISKRKIVMLDNN